MALLTQAIKGTQDILPADSYKWRFVEDTIAEIAENYGFKEIRTPVFEHTELFNRSVGDTTDVVQKEMYTFDDKGGRSITLRPEGTAGAMRAFLEHGLFNEALPVKVFYQLACYRYEKPQAGRLREFHQFGVECFGTDSPAADAEIISLANEIFAFFDIKDIELQINSIGCPTCRAEYQKALREYFGAHESELCETCRGRLERNPMRILDCKSPVCSELAKGAPTVLEYLCDECSEHFEAVKAYLNAMNIPFAVNPSIVRGLDYYTKTVFEFVSSGIGAQGTVCGGGRYDGLAEELGGSHIPSLGFAMGMERFMLVMESQGIDLPEAKKCDLYIATAGKAASLAAAEIAASLREEGVFVLFDTVGRSIRAQLKYANKVGAAFTVVIGDDELESGKLQLREMDGGTMTEMSLDTFAENFAKASLSVSMDRLSEFMMDFGTDDSESLPDLSAFLGGKA